MTYADICLEKTQFSAHISIDSFKSDELTLFREFMGYEEGWQKPNKFGETRKNSPKFRTN